MFTDLSLSVLADSPHDLGVHEVAALSARLSFAFLCLGLSWGVFTSTGWLERLTGRQATRSSHQVLVTTALAFGMLHALAFLLMWDQPFSLAALTIPMWFGGWGEAAGVAGLELMLAVLVSTGLRRFLRYRRWLAVHRLAYPAVALCVAHAFVGAWVDGHLAGLWLAGLLFAVPAALTAVLRFLSPGVLTGLGLLEARR